MTSSDSEWQSIEKLLNEMAEWQRNRLLALGTKIVPNLTSEDILQPNDYPSLENHPHFRYEEGLLAGIQSAQIALRALRLEGCCEGCCDEEYLKKKKKN